MRHVRWSAPLSVAALATLAACSVDAPAPTEATPPSLSRASAPDAAAAPIPGQYIVVFRDDVRDAPGLARQLAAAHGSSPRYVYEHAIKGFAAPVSAQAAAALSRNPNVAYVEQDQVVTADVGGTQNGATWGLDRIDQQALPLNGSYTYPTTASGVTAYIIDTGINFSHTDFGGRAVSGFDFVDNDSDAADCNGHGTHVAGTVGGTTYGVAKGVTLVGIRVLNCSGSGSNSGVIAGMDWAVGNHTAGAPAVANMSLGGGASTATDDAVQRLVDDGIVIAVAAGNGNQAGIAQDACKYSPARAPNAITVGATTKTDAKASYSNYGNCVDFFAPGSGITSDWYSSNTATNTISGTSMATPHVAGAAALYLAQNPGSTPQQVRDGLYAATSKNVVTSSNTANNDLLYIGTAGSPPPANTPPVANFAFSCADLSCNFTDTSTDSDGTITSRSWTFGDNSGSSTSTNPSHTYASAGTYTVALAVTDNGGATDTKTQSVTVSSAPPPSSGEITISAVGIKSRGTVSDVTITWSGALTNTVQIYRNGSALGAPTNNDGNYFDAAGLKGSVTYQVCEVGGAGTCSATVSAST